MRGKSARTVRGPAGAEFRSRPHGRVPQGSPKGRRTWGRLFFGYFLLAKQKKVTCCRAAPGEVVFDLRHKANPPQSPFFKGGRRASLVYPLTSSEPAPQCIEEAYVKF